MTSQFPAFRLRLAAQMSDYRQRLAERIVNTRERQGLSRETLALRSGVSVKQLKRIEDAESHPRLSTVAKLAHALEVEVIDLRPDLELDDDALVDQLHRIETRLDAVAQAVALLLSQQGGDLGPELGELRQELLAASPTEGDRPAQDPPGTSRARTPA